MAGATHFADLFGAERGRERGPAGAARITALERECAELQALLAHTQDALAAQRVEVGELAKRGQELLVDNRALRNQFNTTKQFLAGLPPLDAMTSDDYIACLEQELSSSYSDSAQVQEEITAAKRWKAKAQMLVKDSTTDAQRAERNPMSATLLPREEATERLAALDTIAAMERAVVNLHRIPAARLGTTAYDARQRRNGYDWLSPGIVSSELRLLADEGFIDIEGDRAYPAGAIS